MNKNYEYEKFINSPVFYGFVYFLCRLRGRCCSHNAHEGKVIISLKNGSKIEGWNITDMLPKMKSVKLSDSPKGKKTI